MGSVSVATRHLVGRKEEVETIVRLLDAGEALPGAVVLTGEAGIGKTTLWLAGVDGAAAGGYRVLSARPSEAETQFSFAVWPTSSAGPSDDVLPELPPIQRRALEAALLLGESEIHADERAVAAAFLGALRLLARDGPLCLAVDDVQWLDAASLAALRYALARLEGEPVATLLAVRGDVPEWLRRAVPEDRLERVDVGGLSVGATHELLRTRLDATFPRPTLIRLWETSRGNPFFALELANALQRRGGTLAPGEELPIPPTSTSSCTSASTVSARRRSRSRAPSRRSPIRPWRWWSRPSVAVPRPVWPRRSMRASSSWTASACDSRTRCWARRSPPARRLPAAGRCTPGSREIVPTAEERARHLALAATEPDGEVASILEEAARAAHGRGAPAAAAELAEQALRLTPPANAEDARRRLLIAADMHYAAGDNDRAIALLERARAAARRASSGPRSSSSSPPFTRSPREAVALCREALAEAEGTTPSRRGSTSASPTLMRFGRTGVERGVGARRARRPAASRVDDVALRCRAVAVYGGCCTSSPDAVFRARRWRRRSRSSGRFASGRSWTARPGLRPPARCGRPMLDRARALLLEIGDCCKARNDLGSKRGALWYLAFLEWRAGNWEQADRYAAGSLEL